MFFSDNFSIFTKIYKITLNSVIFILYEVDDCYVYMAQVVEINSTRKGSSFQEINSFEIVGISI